MIGRPTNTPSPADALRSLRFDASEGAPAAARARVLERVRADLAAGVTAPGLPPMPTAGRTGLAAPWVKGLTLAAFALGVATGAALHAWLQHPRADRIVYVDRPVVHPPVAPAAPSVSVAGDSPPKVVTPAPPPGGTHDLAAERALLDRVQRALRTGDVAGAQRAIDAHARRFPNGMLTEEREALAIKVLVAAGRHDEAQRRAARFRERFPDGLFRPSIP